MKKTIWLFLLNVTGAVFTQLSAQSTLSDKINLSREGGTTRVTTTEDFFCRSFLVLPKPEPIIEVFYSRNRVSISMLNYSGGAWIEIIGPWEMKQNYIEVDDMRFEEVTLSGLRPGQFTIRIILDSEVYSGTFSKESYGR